MKAMQEQLPEHGGAWRACEAHAAGLAVTGRWACQHEETIDQEAMSPIATGEPRGYAVNACGVTCKDQLNASVVCERL